MEAAERAKTEGKMETKRPLFYLKVFKAEASYFLLKEDEILAPLVYSAHIKNDKRPLILHIVDWALYLESGNWVQLPIVFCLSLKYVVPDLNLCILNALFGTRQCLSFLM